MKSFILDLFCGAGGAAMGYSRAGFRVVGVDKDVQKRYPFEFIQADALETLEALLAGVSLLTDGGRYWLSDISAIHASPPCQAFSTLASLHKHRAQEYATRYPDLIEPMRALLVSTEKPFVIENVVGAPLREAIMLCGSHFGLGTRCGAELRRHRLFETNWACAAPAACRHPVGGKTIGIYGTGNSMEGRRVISVTGNTSQQNIVRNSIRKTYSVEQSREAMGIDWMTQAELSQAIPPDYTEFVGRQLIEECGR